ncbi:hypothetical protein [Desulforhopalus sp. 52FAK]
MEVLSLTQISLDLTPKDFVEHLHKTAGGEKIAEKGGPIFEENQKSWAPGAVLFAANITTATDQDIILQKNRTLDSFKLCLGQSGKFLSEAKLVICGAYTIGDGLNKALTKASSTHQYLVGYILEQLSLFLLEKTAMKVNSIIEDMALEKGWGVGPLLSPGSVHGWPLTDQVTLCSHLPLSEIGVSCSNNGVLSPFNSLSFVVGIGPDYTESTIGSPCEVCSNRDTCQIRVK